MKHNVMEHSVAHMLRMVPLLLFLLSAARAMELRMDEEAMKTMTGNAPLYMVNVNYDWEHHDPADGVTMVFDPETYSMRMDKGLNTGDGLAWGHMTDDLDKTGWINLFLQTSDTTRATNDVKVFAAGFLEGLMTAARISQFYSNAHQLMMKDESSAHALSNIKRMFHDSLAYVKKSSNMVGGVITKEPPDPYWKQARYLLIQLWGIKDGYNFAAMSKNVHEIDMIDMMVINSHGEMPELMEAYTPIAVKQRRKYQEAIATIQEMSAHHRLRGAKGPSPGVHESMVNLRDVHKTLNPEAPEHSSSHNVSAADLKAADRDWEDRLAKGGRCSAFVRIGPENGDLFVGHTTWDDYSKMTRMFKYYNFVLPNSMTWDSEATASHIAMSSYPGCIGSTDNFYMMNSGIVVADTTLEILNPTIYNRIAEFPANTHLPDFMHVMVANKMSRTANQWTTLFSERNSGTGNAQWLVVDYNLFIPEVPVVDNTFWIVEQIPGIIAKQDMSDWLRKNGYWASYNRPYFPEIRQRSGHAAAEAQYGALYSFGDSPRGTIFKNLGVSVENMFDMRNLMNRNYYPDEGVVPNEPGHAISARMDLDPVNRLPNGGIDAKVVNRCMFRSMQCQAISGPSHAKQKVFKWKDDEDKELFPGWPHLGLPNDWDFNWVQMTPSASLSKINDVGC